MTNKTDLHISK